ncbi:MAG: hypothetical protein OSJ60_08755 [Lachnospiraceae bacterium]|nr:hypothetical protein [Lachnospiraceae bacterium]
MNIINKSRKIISINGEPLLPGVTMNLGEGMEKHPAIADYLERGVIADASKAAAPSADSTGISDFERAKIAEEAIAKYKAEQEAAAQAKAEKEAEIKAVKTMDKDALITKALGMGIDVSDSDTKDTLKEKIFKALGV